MFPFFRKTPKNPPPPPLAPAPQPVFDSLHTPPREFDWRTTNVYPAELHAGVNPVDTSAQSLRTPPGCIPLPAELATPTAQFARQQMAAASRPPTALSLQHERQRREDEKQEAIHRQQWAEFEAALVAPEFTAEQVQQRDHAAYETYCRGVNERGLNASKTIFHK